MSETTSPNITIKTSHKGWAVKVNGVTMLTAATYRELDAKGWTFLGIDISAGNFAII